MAITSPALTLAIEPLFGAIKPALDIIGELGPTDFSAEAPGATIKPGTTMKVPLSTVSEALRYDKDTNNYLTGGDTDWANLTCEHYLQGFDVSGVDIDSGVNAPRIKQLFSKRCGGGIALAAKKAIVSALDSCTASTAVKLAATPAALAEYDILAHAKDWYDPLDSCLVINGAEHAKIKALMHGAHLSASLGSIAEELGFKKVIVMAGMTARAVIVPYSSIGFMGRVPAIIAKYAQAGVETDPESGLSIGIVVAEDQDHNRQVVNGDLWFGVATVSSKADASTPGIIKVGTAN